MIGRHVNLHDMIFDRDIDGSFKTELRERLNEGGVEGDHG